MAKKKLNKYSRSVIIEWMCKEKINENEGQEEILAAYNNVISLINPILTSKYPLEDMVVLRKYNLIRKDVCLKFNVIRNDNGLVFGIDFRWDFGDSFKELSNKDLAEIPYSGGCNNSIVFDGTEELLTAINLFKELYVNRYDVNMKKAAKYRSFVNTCKYLEEVEEVVALPEDMRVRITGESTAITVMNPELINSLKEEFSNVSK